MQAADYQLEEDEDFDNYIFPEEIAAEILKLPVLDVIDINDLELKDFNQDQIDKKRAVREHENKSPTFVANNKKNAINFNLNEARNVVDDALNNVIDMTANDKQIKNADDEVTRMVEATSKKRSAANAKKNGPDITRESVIPNINVAEVDNSAVKDLIKNEDGFIEMSIKELREAANKIISGEIDEPMDIDIKGEVGELLRLIVDAKTKVDDIDPALHQSQENVPHISSSLQEVTDTTEKASMDLMQAAENMQSFYKSFASEIELLKSVAIAGKDVEFDKKYNELIAKLNDAVDLGFKILEALEFQDITEQKLRKVIKSMQDMGGRLGTIIGYLHVNNSKDGKSPKDIEKLLSDYGLS